MSFSSLACRLGMLSVAMSVSVTLSAAEISTTELGRHVRQHLISHANAPDVGAADREAESLCDLYVVLRSDPRFHESEMLQGDAAKVRRRLLTVARSRERQLERDGIARPANLSSLVSKAIQDAIKKRDGGATAGGSSDDSSRSVGAAAGGGGALVVDSGWGLVELIKRIIAPDFWEDRGGNGSIHYFAMRRVLIVRATSDVHQQIQDLLTALR
ncbi:MAG: hypothetical protein AAFV88_03900 [Planctomycetota bacterium]